MPYRKCNVAVYIPPDQGEPGDAMADRLTRTPGCCVISSETSCRSTSESVNPPALARNYPISIDTTMLTATFDSTEAKFEIRPAEDRTTAEKI